MSAAKEVEAVYFAAPPVVEPPASCVIWGQTHSFDGKEWTELAEADKLKLRPTKFEDERILFLAGVEGAVPESLAAAANSDFDHKSWAENGWAVTIERDQVVLIKSPDYETVLRYTHSERLPVLVRHWRPLVFTPLKGISAIKLTESVGLLVTPDGDGATVSGVDWNGGFMCCNPAIEGALAYGAFALRALVPLAKRGAERRVDTKDGSQIVMAPLFTELAPMPSQRGNWGFFVHFLVFGALQVPKETHIRAPSLLSKVLSTNKGASTIAQLLVPPRMALSLRLVLPGALPEKRLVYGQNFLVTAVRSSLSEIEFYVLIDDLFMRYTHSFDIRANNFERDGLHAFCDIKLAVDKDTHAVSAPGTNALTPLSAPPRSEHLRSRQLVAVFDAETTQYSTHTPGTIICDNIKRVAMNDHEYDQFGAKPAA